MPLHFLSKYFPSKAPKESPKQNVVIGEGPRGDITKELPYGLLMLAEMHVNAINSLLEKSAKSSHQFELLDEIPEEYKKIEAEDRLANERYEKARVEREELERRHIVRAQTEEFKQLKARAALAKRKVALDDHVIFLKKMISHAVSLQKTPMWRTQIYDDLRTVNPNREKIANFMTFMEEVWGQQYTVVMLRQSAALHFSEKFNLLDLIRGTDVSKIVKEAFDQVNIFPEQYRLALMEVALTELCARLAKLATSDAQKTLEILASLKLALPNTCATAYGHFKTIIAKYAELTANARSSGEPLPDLRANLAGLWEEISCTERSHRADVESQTLLSPASIILWQKIDDDSKLPNSINKLNSHKADVAQKRDILKNPSVFLFGKDIGDLRVKLGLAGDQPFTKEHIALIEAQLAKVIISKIATPAEVAEIIKYAQQLFTEIKKVVVALQQEKSRIVDEGVRNAAIAELALLQKDIDISRESIEKLQHYANYINIESEIGEYGVSRNQKVLQFSRYLHKPEELMAKVKYLEEALIYFRESLTHVPNLVGDKDYRKKLIDELTQKSAEIEQAQKALANEMLLMLIDIDTTKNISTLSRTRRVFSKAKELGLFTTTYKESAPIDFNFGERWFFEFTAYVKQHGDTAAKKKLSELAVFTGEQPVITFERHGHLQVPKVQFNGEDTSVKDFTPANRPFVWLFGPTDSTIYDFIATSGLANFNELMRQILSGVKLSSTRQPLDESENYILIKWIAEAQKMLKQERDNLASKSWFINTRFVEEYTRVLDVATSQLTETTLTLSRCIVDRLHVSFVQDRLISRESLEAYKAFIRKNDADSDEDYTKADGTIAKKKLSQIFDEKTAFLNIFLKKLKASDQADPKDRYIIIDNSSGATVFKRLERAAGKEGDEVKYEIHQDAFLCEQYHVTQKEFTNVSDREKQSSLEITAVKLLTAIASGRPDLADLGIAEVKDIVDQLKVAPAEETRAPLIKRLNEQLINAVSYLHCKFNDDPRNKDAAKAVARELLVQVTKKYISSQNLTVLSNQQIELIRCFDDEMYNEYSSSMAASQVDMLKLIGHVYKGEIQEATSFANDAVIRLTYQSRRRLASREGERIDRIVIEPKPGEIPALVVSNASRLVSLNPEYRKAFELDRVAEDKTKLPTLLGIVQDLKSIDDPRLVHLERILLNIKPESNDVLAAYRIKLLELYFARPNNDWLLSNIENKDKSKIPANAIDRRALISDIGSLQCSFTSEQLEFIKSHYIDNPKIVEDPLLLKLVKDVFNTEKDETQKRQYLRRLQFSAIRYFMQNDAKDKSSLNEVNEIIEQQLLVKKVFIDYLLEGINTSRQYSDVEIKEFIELLRLKGSITKNSRGETVEQNDNTGHNLVLDEVARVSHQASLDMINQYLPPDAKRAAVHTLCIKLMQVKQPILGDEVNSSDEIRDATDLARVYKDRNLEFLRVAATSSYDLDSDNYFTDQQLQTLQAAMFGYQSPENLNIWPLLRLFIIKFFKSGDKLSLKPCGISCEDGKLLASNYIYRRIRELINNPGLIADDEKRENELAILRVVHDNCFSPEILKSIADLAFEYKYTNSVPVRRLFMALFPEDHIIHAAMSLQAAQQVDAPLHTVHAHLEAAIKFLQSNPSPDAVKLDELYQRIGNRIDGSETHRDAVFAGFLSEVKRLFKRTQPEVVSEDKLHVDASQQPAAVDIANLLKQAIPMVETLLRQVGRGAPAPESLPENYHAIHKQELDFIRKLCEFIIKSINHEVILRAMSGEQRKKYLTFITELGHFAEIDCELKFIRPIVKLDTKESLIAVLRDPMLQKLTDDDVGAAHYEVKLKQLASTLNPTPEQIENESVNAAELHRIDQSVPRADGREELVQKRIRELKTEKAAMKLMTTEQLSNIEKVLNVRNMAFLRDPSKQANYVKYFEALQGPNGKQVYSNAFLAAITKEQLVAEKLTDAEKALVASNVESDIASRKTNNAISEADKSKLIASAQTEKKKQKILERHLQEQEEFRLLLDVAHREAVYRTNLIANITQEELDAEKLNLHDSNTITFKCIAAELLKQKHQQLSDRGVDLTALNKEELEARLNSEQVADEVLERIVNQHAELIAKEITKLKKQYILERNLKEREEYSRAPAIISESVKKALLQLAMNNTTEMLYPKSEDSDDDSDEAMFHKRENIDFALSAQSQPSGIGAHGNLMVSEFSQALTLGWDIQTLEQKTQWASISKGLFFESANDAARYILTYLNDTTEKAYIAQAIIDWLYCMSKQIVECVRLKTPLSKNQQSFNELITRLFPNVTAANIIVMSAIDIIDLCDSKHNSHSDHPLVEILRCIVAASDTAIEYDAVVTQILLSLELNTKRTKLVEESVGYQQRARAFYEYVSLTKKAAANQVASKVTSETAINQQLLRVQIVSTIKILFADNLYARGIELGQSFLVDEDIKDDLCKLYKAEFSNIGSENPVDEKKYVSLLAAIFNSDEKILHATYDVNLQNTKTNYDNSIKSVLANDVISTVVSKMNAAIASRNLDYLKEAIRLFLLAYIYMHKTLSDRKIDKSTSKESFESMFSKQLLDLIDTGHGGLIDETINDLMSIAAASTTHKSHREKIVSGMHNIVQDIQTHVSRLVDIVEKEDKKVTKLSTENDSLAAKKEKFYKGNNEEQVVNFLYKMWELEQAQVEETCARVLTTPQGQSDSDQRAYVDRMKIVMAVSSTQDVSGQTVNVELTDEELKAKADAITVEQLVDKLRKKNAAIIAEEKKKCGLDSVGIVSVSPHHVTARVGLFTEIKRNKLKRLKQLFHDFYYQRAEVLKHLQAIFNEALKDRNSSDAIKRNNALNKLFALSQLKNSWGAGQWVDQDLQKIIDQAARSAEKLSVVNADIKASIDGIVAQDPYRTHEYSKLMEIWKLVQPLKGDNVALLRAERTTEQRVNLENSVVEIYSKAVADLDTTPELERAADLNSIQTDEADIERREGEIEGFVIIKDKAGNKKRKETVSLLSFSEKEDARRDLAQRKRQLAEKVLLARRFTPEQIASVEDRIRTLSRDIESERNTLSVVPTLETLDKDIAALRLNIETDVRAERERFVAILKEKNIEYSDELSQQLDKELERRKASPSKQGETDNQKRLLRLQREKDIDIVALRVKLDAEIASKKAPLNKLEQQIQEKRAHQERLVELENELARKQYELLLMNEKTLVEEIYTDTDGNVQTRRTKNEETKDAYYQRRSADKIKNARATIKALAEMSPDQMKSARLSEIHTAANDQITTIAANEKRARDEMLERCKAGNLAAPSFESIFDSEKVQVIKTNITSVLTPAKLSMFPVSGQGSGIKAVDGGAVVAREEINTIDIEARLTQIQSELAICNSKIADAKNKLSKPLQFLQQLEPMQLFSVGFTFAKGLIQRVVNLASWWWSANHHKHTPVADKDSRSSHADMKLKEGMAKLQQTHAGRSTIERAFESAEQIALNRALKKAYKEGNTSKERQLDADKFRDAVKKATPDSAFAKLDATVKALLPNELQWKFKEDIRGEYIKAIGIDFNQYVADKNWNSAVEAAFKAYAINPKNGEFFGKLAALVKDALAVKNYNNSTMLKHSIDLLKSLYSVSDFMIGADFIKECRDSVFASFKACLTDLQIMDDKQREVLIYATQQLGLVLPIVKGQPHYAGRMKAEKETAVRKADGKVVELKEKLEAVERERSAAAKAIASFTASPGKKSKAAQDAEDRNLNALMDKANQLSTAESEARSALEKAEVQASQAKEALLKPIADVDINILHDKLEKSLDSLISETKFNHKQSVSNLLAFIQQVCVTKEEVSKRYLKENEMRDGNEKKAHQDQTNRLETLNLKMAKVLHTRRTDLKFDSADLNKAFDLFVTIFGLDRAKELLQTLLSDEFTTAQLNRKKQLDSMVNHLDEAFILAENEQSKADEKTGVSFSTDSAIKSFLTSQDRRQFLFNLDEKMTDASVNPFQLYVTFTLAIHACEEELNATLPEQCKQLKVFWAHAQLSKFASDVQKGKEVPVYFEEYYDYIEAYGTPVLRSTASKSIQTIRDALPKNEEPIEFDFNVLEKKPKALKAFTVKILDYESSDSLSDGSSANVSVASTPAQSRNTSPTRRRDSSASLVPPATPPAATPPAMGRLHSAPAFFGSPRVLASPGVPPSKSAASRSPSDVTGAGNIVIPPVPNTPPPPPPMRGKNPPSLDLTQPEPQMPSPLRPPVDLLRSNSDLSSSSSGSALSASSSSSAPIYVFDEKGLARPNGYCGYISIANWIMKFAYDYEEYKAGRMPNLDKPAKVLAFLNKVYEALNEAKGKKVAENFDMFRASLANKFLDKKSRESVQDFIAPLLLKIAHRDLSKDEKGLKKILANLDSANDKGLSPDEVALKSTLSAMWENVQLDIRALFDSFATRVVEKGFDKANEFLELELRSGELVGMSGALKNTYSKFVQALVDNIRNGKITTETAYNAAVAKCQHDIEQHFNNSEFKIVYLKEKLADQWAGRYELEKLSRVFDCQLETLTDLGKRGTFVPDKLCMRLRLVGLHYDAVFNEPPAIAPRPAIKSP